MSLSEIVFYIVVALGLLMVLSVIRSLKDGRGRSAWMTIRLFLILVGIYGAVLMATTLGLPLQTLPVGDTQYGGDWSISVVSMRRLPHDLDEDYEIDFRMGNRALKPIQGVKGLIAYLVSEDGTRYDAAPEPSTPPFDTIVNPGKWVTTTRKFVLPQNLNRVELVLTRTGPRLGMFLIGRYPFDGHTVIQLQ